MFWWQWVVLGILLLGAEMLIDAQFYLVFLGVSAVAVGAVSLVWAGSPVWVEWLLFSVLAIASLLIFRGRLYGKLRGKTPDRGDGVVGEIGTIETDIEPGETGGMKLRGSVWVARNVGEETLSANSRARIESVTGVTADVVSADR
jgi:hypothetical protein